MSDVIETTQADSSAPEDFSAYQGWRRGETVAEPEAEEPQTIPSEAAKAAETDSDSETENEEEQEDGQPRKGKGGFQRRIDRLTRDKAELQARLERLEQMAGGKPAAPAHAEPAPAAKPALENFDTYEEYTEALVEWKANERLAAHVAEQRKAAQEREQAEREKTRATTFQERAKAAAAKYADFEKVAFSDDVPASETMRDIILDSENGPEIAYFLGKNPAEAERIAQLSPLAAARELGRIEAKLATADVPKPQPRVTRAPEPIRPVTPAARTRSFDLNDDSAAQDYRAWEKARLAQMRKA